MKLKTSARIALFALLACAATIPWITNAQEPAASTQKRAALMRQKLDLAKSVLEGLTKDDLPTVADAAQKLKRLSAAAEWEVPTIPDVEQYIPYTTDFQRICDSLSKNAREKNLDAATLSYVQLTINCVNCHKYVRGVKR